ncbi:MAG: hypothetical protein ACLVK4_01935 [Alistipes shahii]
MAPTCRCLVISPLAPTTSRCARW